MEQKYFLVFKVRIASYTLDENCDQSCEHSVDAYSPCMAKNSLHQYWQ